MPSEAVKIDKERFIQFIHTLQNDICQALETEDGKARFREDRWQRKLGGGGITRIIEKGSIFEKGGVNTSVVHGATTDLMRQQLNISGEKWFAAGLSLVLHPYSPMVPTVHCNYRLFELYDAENKVVDQWFGGGTDLTPYYLFDTDALHFHQVFKNITDQFDSNTYALFKKNCDDYFVNTHRNNERRGIGGIFYDHQRPTKEKPFVYWLNYAKACGYGFLEAYLPIVQKRKNLPFSPHQKMWQEIRRGRYIEFNLIHDKGTLFGLKTNGRTESILMSLPLTARFEYDYIPAKNSEEEKLLNIFLNPIDWIK